MSEKEYISIEELCAHYQIETTFFSRLTEYGLVETQTIQQVELVHVEQIDRVEKVLRMHRDLELNLEGIDVVMNLLDRIDQLQQELISTRNRLRMFEED
jgi:hypothetical protein